MTQNNNTSGRSSTHLLGPRWFAFTVGVCRVWYPGMNLAGLRAVGVSTWGQQRAERLHHSAPQEKGNGDKKRGAEGRSKPGEFIAPSHGLTASAGLGSPRTEPPRLQEPKTKGGRKRNLCLDKHEVEKVRGRGIWAPRTFSNHKFSTAALKPGNLNQPSEIYYPRSRQGQFSASSPILTLPSLQPAWAWVCVCAGGMGCTWAEPRSIRGRGTPFQKSWMASVPCSHVEQDVLSVVRWGEVAGQPQ